MGVLKSNQYIVIFNPQLEKFNSFTGNVQELV